MTKKLLDKLTLSIEQIQHLQELGIDTSDAEIFRKDRNGNKIPTYTLQEFLEKLPDSVYPVSGSDRFNTYYPNIFSGYSSRFSVSYGYYGVDDYEEYEELHSEEDDNLLTAVYNMICWLCEHHWIR